MIFFFFKQKTAYEMRISDWSSDVCSSDLWARLAAFGIPARMRGIPAIGIADRSIPVMAMEIARAQNGTIAIIPPSLGDSSCGEGEIAGLSFRTDHVRTRFHHRPKMRGTLATHCTSHKGKRDGREQLGQKSY